MKWEWNWKNCYADALALCTCRKSDVACMDSGSLSKLTLWATGIWWIVWVEWGELDASTGDVLSDCFGTVRWTVGLFNAGRLTPAGTFFLSCFQDSTDVCRSLQCVVSDKEAPHVMWLWFEACTSQKCKLCSQYTSSNGMYVAYLQCLLDSMRWIHPGIQIFSSLMQRRWLLPLHDPQIDGMSAILVAKHREPDTGKMQGRKIRGSEEQWDKQLTAGWHAAQSGLGPSLLLLISWPE